MSGLLGVCSDGLAFHSAFVLAGSEDFLRSRFLLGAGDVHHVACGAGPRPPALCLAGGCWPGDSVPRAPGVTQRQS